MPLQRGKLLTKFYFSSMLNTPKKEIPLSNQDSTCKSQMMLCLVLTLNTIPRTSRNSKDNLDMSKLMVTTGLDSIKLENTSVLDATTDWKLAWNTPGKPSITGTKSSQTESTALQFKPDLVLLTNSQMMLLLVVMHKLAKTTNSVEMLPTRLTRTGLSVSLSISTVLELMTVTSTTLVSTWPTSSESLHENWLTSYLHYLLLFKI